MDKPPRNRAAIMRDHRLLLVFLLPLITSCAASRLDSATSSARLSSQDGSMPFGAEFRPPEETPPSPVQLASVSPLVFAQGPAAEPQPQAASPAQGAAYRIRNGDEISVKFLKNPELDASVPVRPDGNISLPLVGEIAVRGLPMTQLRPLISQMYKDFIAQTGYGEVLKEGDYLDLRFIYNPELNLGVRIRSDGKISLPLLGEMQAADLRPAELHAQLVKGYARLIANPDVALLVGPETARKIFADEPFIAVTLTKSANQQVFVGGEVLTPRAIKFDERITVLQALMDAGGVKETGDLSRVVVLRRGQFEEANWTQTDLSHPLSGKSLQNDLVLRNGDVVVVPMSGIAKVDLFVKQYIREVLPVQSGFSISIIPLDSGNRN